MSVAIRSKLHMELGISDMSWLTDEQMKAAAAVLDRRS
jgi:hypothetical protein